MNLLPISINNDENVVRAVFCPYHIKNGKIKPQAFRPTPGTDEVSVMRSDWLGPDTCKKKAKEMEKHNANPPKTYKGFAILSAGGIRLQGIDVIDSRIHYEGHADIKLGIKELSGEPLPPEQMMKLKELTEALARRAFLCNDPNPQSETWDGSPLIFNNQRHMTVEAE